MNPQVERKYTIVNLGCAHCAAKMEHAISTDTRIASASIDYMQSSLLVSYDADHFETEEELYHVLNSYVSKYEQEAYLMAATPSLPASHVPGHDDCCNLPNAHNEDSCDSTNTLSLSPLITTIVPWAIGIIISMTGMIFIKTPLVNLALILLGYIILGHKVLKNSFKNILHGVLFDENFLMILATIGALYVGNYMEALAVLLLFQIGEFLQSLAVDKSKKNIKAAMNLKVLSATVETVHGLKQSPPEEVQVGDLLVIRPSERIPLDGIVAEGTSFLDTSSLTGESIPRKVKPGDDVLSGCINGAETIKVTVTKPYEESTVAKVLALVEHANSRKSPTEHFITKFARVYTPIVVLLAAVIAIIPPMILRTWDFSHWIYTACSFLVVSCPCALVISVPLGFFGGIGCASKNGILIKGSNYLEGLTTLKTVVFDKTGTLTKGCFHVREIKTLSSMTEDSILTLAALLESYSTHPIATSIVTAYKECTTTTIDTTKLTQYKEVSGHGVQAVIQNETYYLGNKRYMDVLNISHVPDSLAIMGTVVYLAKGTECEGYLVIADELKEDAKDTITALKRAGVRTVLLTGDTKTAATQVGEVLGMDAVYAELLPTDKVSQIEKLMKQSPSGQKTAFVGDGINDAPVIARADIGLAMGGVGSDAAIEAADIVLMRDEPNKIVMAMAIATHTKHIVTINILFSLGTKLLVLMLLACGIGTMWLAIFADVGVSLLAILNSIRTLTIKVRL